MNRPHRCHTMLHNAMLHNAMLHNAVLQQPQHNQKQLSQLPFHQKGAIMIISLIMLFVLSLLATASMDTSIVDEKMAGNTQHENQLYQRNISEGIENTMDIKMDRSKLTLAKKSGSAEPLSSKTLSDNTVLESKVIYLQNTNLAESSLGLFQAQQFEIMNLAKAGKTVDKQSLGIVLSTTASRH